MTKTPFHPALTAGLLCATIVLFSGCERSLNESAEPSQGSDPTTWISVPSDAVVASSRGAQITAQELDDRILSLSAAERSDRGAEPVAWYREHSQELLVAKLLHAEALNAKLMDTPAFGTAQARAKRDAVLAMCMQRQTYADPQVTEDMLRNAYQTDIEKYSKPETRLTYHIFLYATEERPLSAVETELNTLRKRVEAGENFRVLAKQVSESSSRHSNAVLGWLRHDDVTPDLAEAIFSATEDTPIGPVMTQEGGHLFWVDIVKPATTVSFEAARDQLAPIVVSRHVEDIFKHLGADVATTWNTAEVSEILTALNSSDSDITVFSSGAYTVELTDLRARLSRYQSAGQALNLAQAVRAELNRLKLRESAYQACRDQQLYDAEQLDRALRNWSREYLIAERRAEKLTSMALADEDRLREFYTNNLGFFTTPVRWQIKLYTARFSEDAVLRFNRLEHADDMNDQQLSALFHAWHGETRAPQWFNKAALDRIAQNAAAIIAPMSIGQRSAPFRIGSDGIAIAQLIDKETAAAPPFERIKERVAAYYRRQYTAELYAQMMTELLAEQTVSFNQDIFQAFASGAVVDSNISAESLESMLLELEDAR